MLLGIFLPDMNDIFNWLLNLNGIISPGVTCWIFYSFMRIRKNSKKFPSDYVFIKNDKLAYAAGLFLLVVTAAATIMGIAPQDVKQYGSIWWYELIINVISIIVLIGLGAILQESGAAKRNTVLPLAGHNGLRSLQLLLSRSSLIFTLVVLKLPFGEFTLELKP